MTLDLAILIFASLINLALGVLVFARNVRLAENRAFLWVSLSITGWTVANYLTDHAPSLALGTVYDNAAFGFAYLVITSLLSFTFFFSYKKLKRRWLLPLWGIVVAAGTAFASSSLVAGPVVQRANGVDVTPGPFYVAFILVTILFFLLALHNLAAARKRAVAARDVLRRKQVNFIFYGLAVSFILAALTNAIIPALTNNWEVAKVGPLVTAFLVGSVTYAIVKHRLFDIRLVVARSMMYVLLLGTLACLYGAAIFGISRYVFPLAGTTTTQEAIYIVLALVLAFTFQPLRRFFERLTDQLFYRDHYDAQEVLNRVGKILASELLLDKLLHSSLQQICLSLRIESGQFMIFDKDQVYKVAHYGPVPDKLLTAPTAQKLRQGVLVADELSSGERKEVMSGHGIRVSLMLRTREEFVGFLFLGDKQSGNIYGEQDIKMLEILAGEISIAISNAKAYEAIAQFNVTLQEKVEHATGRLRQVNKHLEEMDKAKDDFISMAAHQLRTPLTTIKGYLSMMLEGDTGKLTPEQQEFAGYAFDGAERMVSLVSDLLNVSRMSSGKFMIERQPTDIVAVIEDEVRQLERHATAKGLKLLFDPPKRKIPEISLDEGKTRQVIMNFIDNAVYYTKTGSVRVEVECNKERLKVTVTDTGIGVPKESMAKLFTKFYRAENAQQVRADGTGLGLYLAKRVIEDQGGTIIVESEVGRGSTFGFELPLTPPRSTKK